MENVTSLVRPNIASLKPYSSARSEFTGENKILLDANENPFELWEMEKINRYPDPLQTNVKQIIAQIKGIKPEQLFIGNGSDEAVDLIIRCFCEPASDRIAIFEPTYGMYSVCATINNIGVEKYLLKDDFCIDADSFLNRVTKDVKVVFICNPNNPTGNSQKFGVIEQILSEINGLVVVDEAYIDFCSDKSVVSLVNRYPNLIVLQTFSKAWGLAGARIGLAIANRQIISILNRVKFPYNIGKPSLQILKNSLSNKALMEKFIAQITGERQNLYEQLKQFSFITMVYPSEANFLLVKTTNAQKIYTYLLDKNIVVRNRSHEPLCSNCLRITVGTPAENQILIETLKKLNL
ncbi:histidinol-phosphate transaminase [Tenuifilum thalassicum]|uniref:Histidinol-phosphate aminotransferase n=1 Tax=Tenuifilum thalassicum TaxID=2590900 RepID=A0A7D3XFP5_9BACT|nr:histidinol-phosphate transaminase [Tenuifilum thalassicum]